MKIIIICGVFVLILSLIYSKPILPVIFLFVIIIILKIIKNKNDEEINEINKNSNNKLGTNLSDYNEKNYNDYKYEDQQEFINLEKWDSLREIIKDAIKDYDPLFSSFNKTSNRKAKGYFEHLKYNYESAKQTSEKTIKNSDIYNNVIILLKKEGVWMHGSEPAYPYPPTGYRLGYDENYDSRPTPDIKEVIILGSVFYKKDYHYFIIEYSYWSDSMRIERGIRPKYFKDYKEMIAYVLLEGIISKTYLRKHMKFHGKKEQEMFYEVMSYTQ